MLPGNFCARLPRIESAADIRNHDSSRRAQTRHVTIPHWQAKDAPAVVRQLIDAVVASHAAASPLNPLLDGENKRQWADVAMAMANDSGSPPEKYEREEDHEQ
jgi:ABC-type cobalamin/Fe3+-siderophores transport system ATPase subunit